MIPRNTLLQAGSVFLFAFVTFLGGVTNKVTWDDSYLLNNRVAGEQTFHSLLAEPYMPQDDWRPLSVVVLYAEKTVFGDWIPGYRLTGYFLHGFASVALFFLLKRFASEPVAWLAALLFAVHPIHAEAVGMAYGQQELLSALWGFAALIQYIRAVRESRAAPLAAAMVLAFLAAGFKDTAIMLPALAVLIRGFFLKPSEGWRTRWITWREALFALPAVAYIGLRAAVLHHLFNATPSITARYTTAMRIKVAIVTLGNFIRLSLLPTGQTVYYGHLRFVIAGHPWTDLAWIGSAVIIAMAAAREIGGRAVAFGTGWFLATLLLLLKIVPSLVLVGERNLYVPVAGVAFVAAVLVYRHWPPSGPWRVAMAALIVLCVIDGNRVVRQWRDSETLWRTTLSSHPDSPLAHVGLGLALLETPGHEAEAEELFHEALDLNPGLDEAKQALRSIGR